MRCPFCDLEKRGNHIYLCLNKPDLSKDELKKEYLEYNYPNIATYEFLYKNYIDLKLSLPEINRLYNIDYNSIKFLLKYYNIGIRSYSESYHLCNKRRIETNIKRYGAINVLSKGTVKYEKRNKTVKDKYNVDNVFQIKEVIEKINDDKYYLEKYNMTKKQLASLNSKIMWSSLSDDQRYLFLERCNEKRNKTWFEKYGGHPIKNEMIIDKIKKTNNEKYGCDYFFQSDLFINNNEIKQKAKETRIKNGFEISEDLLSQFDIYKKKCRILTNRVRKILYDCWDGYDYYDGEYIKDFLNLNNTNKKYPTIDHKISIFNGFINNVDEEDICKLENLCITKRTINCSKREKNNYENV